MLRVPVASEGLPHATSACFSPDARTLALEWDDGSVRLWEMATGNERGRLGEAAPRKAAEKPAPGVGVVAGVGVLARAIFPVAFRPGAGSLAFSPDGRFLAQVNARAVTLWDVAARKELRQLKGHVGDIAALAYAPDGKTLATGSADGTGLVWDVARLTEPATRPAADVKEEALKAAWDALAGEDAARAYDGMMMLAAAPGQGMRFLHERLKPAAAPNAKELADWIARLDSDEFEVRQKAAEALRKVGPTAGPVLREARAARPSAEVKRRIDTLLAEIDRAKLSGEDLRALRAVEVLEMVRSPEAREVLKALAGGAPGAKLTEAAREARQRIGK
jgi:hypothetical protein